MEIKRYHCHYKICDRAYIIYHYEHKNGVWVKWETVECLLLQLNKYKEKAEKYDKIQKDLMNNVKLIENKMMQDI